MSSNNTLGEWLPWLYGGVDFELAGNGGPECLEYLTLQHRFWETVLVLSTSVIEICVALKHINESSTKQVKLTSHEQNGQCLQQNGIVVKPKYDDTKRPFLQFVLLAALVVVFGIEILYKIITSSCIFLLNPCHVLTISQMYLLTVDNRKSSPTAKAIFRIHLHALSGALLAIVLPVTNTRHLPFEAESYWVHHILLYASPIYLIACGNNFTPEPLTDCWWPMLSIGMDFFYHFSFLQALAMVTTVNLNNMLCPAVSDPFEGTNYRLWAFVHQHLLVAIHGKLYHLAARCILKLLAGLLWCTLYVRNALHIQITFPNKGSRTLPNNMAAQKSKTD